MNLGARFIYLMGDMKRSSKPILVTGSHRSGTTWTGRMLSAAPRVAYIHEPFNFELNHGIQPNPFNCWFQYICDENAGKYIPYLDKVIYGTYPLVNTHAEIKSARDLARIMRDCSLHLWHQIYKYRILMKDPIALFSADWLYKKYNMNVLVLIRHPAAFCSSLKIKNWEFDFSNFTRQPLLMEKYLYPFEKEIHEFTTNKKNIIEQGILLWKCFHSTIKIYQEKYPQWLFVRHKDLSADPINQFRPIYKELGLEFTQKVKEVIHANSGSQNPVEQNEENEFIRNSKKTIRNWMTRLSQEEIRQIRLKTSEIASSFYTDKDW